MLIPCCFSWGLRPCRKRLSSFITLSQQQWNVSGLTTPPLLAANLSRSLSDQRSNKHCFVHPWWCNLEHRGNGLPLTMDSGDCWQVVRNSTSLPMSELACYWKTLQPRQVDQARGTINSAAQQETLGFWLFFHIIKDHPAIPNVLFNSVCTSDQFHGETYIRLLTMYGRQASNSVRLGKASCWNSTVKLAPGFLKSSTFTER